MDTAKNESLTRKEEIHAKGFDMNGYRNYSTVNAETDYKRIKVGVKNLDDAVLNLGSLQKALPGNRHTSKAAIMKALADNNLEDLREISNFYYKVNGLYERVCNYFAYLYRYDWYVAAEIFDDGKTKVKEDKVLQDFAKVLNYLDNSYIRKICGDIALEVIKNGCYYGYLVPSSDGIVL